MKEKIKHYFQRVGEDTLTGLLIPIWAFHLFVGMLLITILSLVAVLISFIITL